jgi:hypothetical protein
MQPRAGMTPIQFLDEAGAVVWVLGPDAPDDA